MKSNNKTINLSSFRSLSNKDLVNTHGGMAPDLIWTLFSVGYAIGTDIAKRRKR